MNTPQQNRELSDEETDETMAKSTCIFGNGPCARHIACELHSAGIDLIIASREEGENFSSFLTDKT